MALYWICVISLLGVVAFGDDSCPSSKDISPCTCDVQGVNCMGTLTLYDIKKAFQAKFKDDSVPTVWVQGTPLTNLPADLFGKVKSQQFFIEMNSITTVDLKALSASYQTLRTLSLYGNKIRDLSFNMDDLMRFENLTTLNLGRNLIEIIPTHTFAGDSLQVINLMQNNICHIEEKAFMSLASLGRLELAFNKITAIGDFELSFLSHSDRLQIDLSDNQISDIHPTGFIGSPKAVFFSRNQLTSMPKENFTYLVYAVGNNGGFLEVSGNPFSCKGCDYSWLVTNKDILASKLIGFMCEDQIRTLADLTASNIECHS